MFCVRKYKFFNETFKEWEWMGASGYFRRIRSDYVHRWIVLRTCIHKNIYFSPMIELSWRLLKMDFLIQCELKRLCYFFKKMTQSGWIGIEKKKWQKKSYKEHEKLKHVFVWNEFVKFIYYMLCVILWIY